MRQALTDNTLEIPRSPSRTPRSTPAPVATRARSKGPSFCGLALLLTLAFTACPQAPDDETPSPEPDITATQRPSETSTPTTPSATQSPTETTSPTDTASPTGTQMPTDSPNPTPTTPPTGPTPTAAPSPTLIPTPPTLEPDLDADGFSPSEGDCDDTNDSIHPGAAEVPYDGIDQDCSQGDVIDVDEDGYPGQPAGGTDCNDQDQNSYPGAPEIGDGKDNDCDGQIDDGVDTVDNDLDGLSELEGDCNDEDPSTYPGATEIPYDGIDQDCSGLDLTDVDGDGVAGGPEGQDCNDSRPDTYPGATEIPYDTIDQDCSGSDLIDVDGDGFAAATTPGGTDCHDTNPLIHPGVAEVPYDGIDQDCSGTDLTDVDGDGIASTQVTGGTDCNDANASIFPGAVELCDGVDNNCDGTLDSDAVDRTQYYTDADLDGFGNAQSPQLACTLTAGLSSNATDCNDTRADVNPQAVELCNSIDDNCNSVIDEGVKLTFYEDADGDGFGSGANALQACSAPEGYVSDPTDCDDAVSSTHPQAPEACNAVDDDCDTVVDEDVQTTYYQDADADGYGDALNTTEACTLPEGYAANAEDCDDTRSSTYPGASESCNDVDDDCDGLVDEAVKLTWYLDGDSDGFGNASSSTLSCAAPPGYVSDASDCDDSTTTTFPGATELCNTVDDNCDGQVDEDVTLTYYADGDDDGYGDVLSPTQDCSLPEGYTEDQTDCDDTNASIYPGAIEVCNTVDDSCDGQVDEEVTLTFYQDSDEDGYGTASSTTQACEAPDGYIGGPAQDCNDSRSDVNPDARELDQDGVDSNCDRLEFWPGTGAEGSLIIPTNFTLDYGRSLLTSNISVGAMSFTVSNASQLEDGAEIVIVTLQGANAGIYETNIVQSISGNILSLKYPMRNAFSSAQRVMIQRIPHFTDVTVNSGITVSAPLFGTSGGGMIFVRATGTIRIAGTLRADGAGFVGGTSTTYGDGMQGESYTGTPSMAQTNNYGGGGGGDYLWAGPPYGNTDMGGAGGAGGGHGTVGKKGEDKDNGTYIITGGTAGAAYGNAQLSTLFLGSGGGAGAGDVNVSIMSTPGARGGGIIVLIGKTILIEGTVSANGSNGIAGASADVGGGGGGAGGSLNVMGNTISVTGKLSAVGGNGGAGGYWPSSDPTPGTGGNGGAGRIRVDYTTLNGGAYPTTAPSTIVPTPGYTAPATL